MAKQLKTVQLTDEHETSSVNFNAHLKGIKYKFIKSKQRKSTKKNKTQEFDDLRLRC